MDLPPESANERRAVPRHIRDGEHDMWRDGLGEVPAGPHCQSYVVRLWIGVGALVVAGLLLFRFLSR